MENILQKKNNISIKINIGNFKFALKARWMFSSPFWTHLSWSELNRIICLLLRSLLAHHVNSIRSHIPSLLLPFLIRNFCHLPTYRTNNNFNIQILNKYILIVLEKIKTFHSHGTQTPFSCLRPFSSNATEIQKYTFPRNFQVSILNSTEFWAILCMTK